MLDSLRDQESMVTSRGADLVLVGGGPWGTIYAVYDFLENEVGYRNFGPYPGGERFVQADRLVFSGNETRRRPAFAGYRDEHTLYAHPDKAATSRFFVSNRGNRALHRGGVDNVHVSFALGTHFPWTFPDTEFEFWASLKFSGPDFDPQSQDSENTISCDQVFLVPEVGNN